MDQENGPMKRLEELTCRFPPLKQIVTYSLAINPSGLTENEQAEIVKFPLKKFKDPNCTCSHPAS